MPGATLRVGNLPRSSGVHTAEDVILTGMGPGSGGRCGDGDHPLLAEGQLHGSLAQGLGQVLMEEIVYDRDGQLLTGTLMDCAIPRADEVPQVLIVKTCTPRRSTRSAPRAWGRPGASASRPPWSMPPWMRRRPSA